MNLKNKIVIVAYFTFSLRFNTVLAVKINVREFHCLVLKNTFEQLSQIYSIIIMLTKTINKLAKRSYFILILFFLSMLKITRIKIDPQKFVYL